MLMKIFAFAHIYKHCEYYTSIMVKRRHEFNEAYNKMCVVVVVVVVIVVVVQYFKSDLAFEWPDLPHLTRNSINFKSPFCTVIGISFVQRHISTLFYNCF